MKTIAAIITMVACLAACFAADDNHKAYMFAPTSFGMLIPSGFSRDTRRPELGPDFRVWVFTNAAGSRLIFASGGHPARTGDKADFKGFAALESKTNMVRRIVFDSSGFSHEELNRAGKQPEYDALIEYQAADPGDQTKLDEFVQSFFLGKKQSNTPSDRTR